MPNVAPVPYQTPMMDSNGRMALPWVAWFRQLFVRIGGNDADLLINPMTSIGDLIYGGTSGSPLRLGGDTSDARKFLRELSIGGTATPPVWDTLAASDIPALAYVTSIAMTVPTILSVTPSSITSSGTFALGLANQNANFVFAGLSSGAASSPLFRRLVNADLPSMANNTVKGNISGSSSTPSDLTAAQITALINAFTATLSGAVPASGGGTTKFLRADSTWASPTTSLTPPTVQKFTSGTGTYTAPTNPSPLYIRVRMVGGGGGGGGSGTSNGGAGGTGVDTTFGTSLLVAHGGNGGVAGGTAVSSGATGGTASLGSGPIGIALTGGGGGGNTSDGTSSFSIGGFGASSAFGGGGTTQTDAIGGAGVANTGGGGSGAGNNASASNWSGCGGGSGGFLDAIITSPAATYSYAVGAGGSAGTAGSPGFAGGAGGSGIIIVEEYYQ